MKLLCKRLFSSKFKTLKVLVPILEILEIPFPDRFNVFNVPGIDGKTEMELLSNCAVTKLVGNLLNTNQIFIVQVL